MSPTPEARKRGEYLAELLQKNPIFEAAEILRLRRQFHGLASTAIVDGTIATDVRVQREAIVRQLDQLREAFWTSTTEELEQALQNLREISFPDLRQAAQRLQTLVQFRPSMASLVQGAHFDSELFGNLKRVLVLPPAQAETIRERVYKSIDSHSRRKQVRRMIALIRRQAPEIYQLEKGWFDRISSHPGNYWSGEPHHWYSINLNRKSAVGWIILVVLGFVIGIQFLRP